MDFEDRKIEKKEMTARSDERQKQERDRKEEISTTEFPEGEATIFN